MATPIRPAMRGPGWRRRAENPGLRRRIRSFRPPPTDSATLGRALARGASLATWAAGTDDHRDLAGRRLPPPERANLLRPLCWLTVFGDIRCTSGDLAETEAR